MPTVTQPLVNYLGSRNPILDVSRCSSTGGNSRSTSVKNPWMFPRVIKRWDDFGFDALRSVYGGVLHKLLERQFQMEPTTVPSGPYCQIHGEPSLEFLIGKWNQTVVQNALNLAHEQLQNRLHLEEIYMVPGDQAERPLNLRPDWAGIKPSTVPANETEAKSKNFLPGDTKLSSKWSSSNIEIGEVERSRGKVDRLRPVAQIYTYCIEADARYGYIIADKELVVFRIQRLPESNEAKPYAKHSKGIKAMIPKMDVKKFEAMQLRDKTKAEKVETSGILEFKSIPWKEHLDQSNAEGGVLTVNLALWWLHMMAAESSSIEEQYPPLRDAVWNAEPQTPRTSSASLSRPKIKKTHVNKAPNKRRATSICEPKRGHDMRLRERAKATEYPKQASQQKRRTRRH